MSKFARAKSEGLIAIEVSGELIVQDTIGREVARLDRIAGLVWQLADGEPSTEEIAHKLTTEFDTAVDNEGVWSALDRLADCDLLVTRVTPPASSNSVSRRGIIRTAAAISGGAVGSSIFSAAVLAQNSEQQMKEDLQKRAQENDEKSGKEQSSKEQQQKEQEQEGKQQ